MKPYEQPDPSTESHPADPDLADLVEQIAYLQQALTAISSGGVDAVVLGAPENEQVYTLTNADRPYRVIVERMGEGAATVSERGVVLFANPRLAQFIGVERDSMIGRDITAYVGADQQQALLGLLETAASETRRTELTIAATDGTHVPVLVAATALDLEGVLVRCLVFTDLTMQKQVERQLAEEAAQAERQRVAREVNDTIVQGLVTAEMALDLELYAEARNAVASTSAQARRWIGELAVDHQVQPGTAVRATPAEPERDLP
jgi:PAS domain S-box-containing protein